MALEQLKPTGAAGHNADGGGGGGDDGMRAARLPRWTRQEILVLIQGKKVAENRVRRGRTGGLAFGGTTAQVEPKWASVSSYCKRHGVNRGPVQCRKRWSNLAGDFKKIKEWETQIREETDSFWVMRNDLRREKKLPGFFDREVYDILDGGGPGGGSSSPGMTPTVLALALTPSPVLAPAVKDGDEPDVEEEEKEEEETLFDSGRSAGACAEDGLFSDFEQQRQDDEFGRGSTTDPHRILPPVTATTPIAPFSCSGGSHEKPQTTPDNPPAAADTEETAHHPHQAGRKRKWFETGGNQGDEVEDKEEEEANMQQVHNNKLIKALEDNGRLLSSHLEAQNTHLQLEREQRKDQVNSLVQVLNKLADAFVRIADRL